MAMKINDANNNNNNNNANGATLYEDAKAVFQAESKNIDALLDLIVEIVKDTGKKKSISIAIDDNDAQKILMSKDDEHTLHTALVAMLPDMAFRATKAAEYALARGDMLIDDLKRGK